jgi:hypothetical protein
MSNGIFVPTVEDKLRWSVELAERAKQQGAAIAPPFKRAVKYDAKLRLAISGPAGSGKTYTLLKFAALLGGPVAAVDTEHGSMAKYADEFAFDVEELATFDPLIVPERIQQASGAGYRSLIIDSLSHFWNGKDGELEQVDRITARSKSNNSWAAWREVSPKHNKLVEAIITAPIHVLVGMRVKTEWLIESGKDGKMQPKRVGLQSIMRDGIEYEFDVAADMDLDHNFIVTKSRCPKLDGQIYHKPGEEVAEILKVWVHSPVIRPLPDLTGMRQHFVSMREKLGDDEFLAILGIHGYEHIEEIPDPDAGTPIYKAMIVALRGRKQQ